MSTGAFAFDDGATTTIERWGRTGPIVLGVHGMTSSRKSWERLAQHLEGRFQIVAYDQRGHGDSAAVTGPMALARGVADVCQIARAIGEPVDMLVGHSWGGALALLAAPFLPVRRIAVIDPMVRQAPLAWYDEYVVELREQFALTGDERAAAVRADYASWDPVDVDAKVHAVASMTVAPIEGLRDDNPPSSWDLRKTVAAFPKPLLLAMAAPGEGINDDATLAEIERRHSPEVEIVTFPGAGHNLHRTDFPAFARTLDEFLARTT